MPALLACTKLQSEQQICHAACWRQTDTDMACGGVAWAGLRHICRGGDISGMTSERICHTELEVFANRAPAYTVYLPDCIPILPVY